MLLRSWLLAALKVISSPLQPKDIKVSCGRWALTDREQPMTCKSLPAQYTICLGANSFTVSASYFALCCPQLSTLSR